MELASAEYERFADVVAGLSGDDWGKQTDCPDWDVRQLACQSGSMAITQERNWRDCRRIGGAKPLSI